MKQIFVVEDFKVSDEIVSLKEAALFKQAKRSREMRENVKKLVTWEKIRGIYPIREYISFV